MSTVPTTSLPTPRTTRRTGPASTRRGAAATRWALLAALVAGAAGGAGVSAAVVHAQVRVVHDVRTVYVPAPTTPEPTVSKYLQQAV